MTMNRITGFLSLVLGIGVGILTSQLPESKMANDIGPAVFPYITAGLLVICGIGLIMKKSQEEKEAYFDKEALLRLAKIAVVVIGYIILEAWLGFLIPSILVLFTLCLMFSKPGQTAWWQALLFAVLVSGIVYLLFTKGFSLVLPRCRLKFF